MTMSLRSRLVAGFILVAVVLLGTDTAVALFVHRSLIQAVDQRLDIARGGPARTSTAPAPTNNEPQPGLRRLSAFTDIYIQVVSPTGQLVSGTAPQRGRHAPEPPAIPTDLVKHASPVGTAPRPFSVGSGAFRAVALRTRAGDILFIAVSLRDTAATFRNVLIVEGAATLAVLIAIGLVAWFVLHLGVRPLDQMAETADAIAAGDLSRRVERAEPHTEAGRLGLALNTMLGEIEDAFAQQGRSEERLRRFVADASHELRTPLTSIRGYAELWRQGGLRDEAELADAMRRVEMEARRMGVLVDEMLLLARLDQGRPLDSAPVDLARVVRDAVADLRAVEPDRPVSIDAPQHLTVRGDEPRLAQVVTNLLANARIHTPRGTPVRVRVAPEGDKAVLEVEDDGPGLGPDPHRVFERFYRADPARARARGGAGLGLSIVAAVSEAHGGTASAAPSASGGARLRIELPASDDGIVAQSPGPDQRTAPAAAEAG